jgi:hypothetical protein
MCKFDGVGSHVGRTESEYLRNGGHVIEAVERSLIVIGLVGEPNACPLSLSQKST